MTGVLQWMAKCSSEKTEGEEVEEWLWMLVRPLTKWKLRSVMISLRVRIRGKVNKANILVGIFYRSLKQDEEVDELFY